MKKQYIHKIFSAGLLFALVFGIALPIETLAQSYSGGWGEMSSTLSRKINKLDEDRVDELPVSILMGLTPDGISSNFGDVRSGGRKHEGLDMMAPLGAMIVSPTEAVVIRTGDGESSGKYVYTANPGDETFVYMHLDEIADIKSGDVLDVGDLIGYVGNTGNASGGSPHLHFEIQHKGEALDPHPRIKRVFPLKDKIEYLENILDDADDEDELAESVVAMYSRELLLARTMEIELPSSIEEAMTNPTTPKTATKLSASLITRTLKVGSTGEDVKMLQASLGLTADGSFGPKTKAAVIEFQKSKGLTADGVFGPMSRSALEARVATSKVGCTATTIYSPQTGVKC